MSVNTGIKAVSLFQCNFTPFINLNLSAIWDILKAAGDGGCADVCSRTFSLKVQSKNRQGGGWVFFSLWVKKHSSCRVPFKLMYLLLTYFQFPDCQCVPCSAGHAGSCAGPHNSSNELLTFCLRHMVGWSQKTHHVGGGLPEPATSLLLQNPVGLSHPVRSVLVYLPSGPELGL